MTPPPFNSIPLNMESETPRKTRSRAEILGAIAAIPHAVQGKVCEMRKRLAGGGTATYYNLQYWSEGRNHSIHVPREKLAEFKEGRAGAVVEEAGRMADGGKNAAEVDRKLQYYRDNYDRMRYDEYILNGWFIGSGVVESGCKCVVQQRLGLSGMHWSLKGAEALLPLRTLHKSNRLEEFFAYLVRDLRQVDCAA